MISLMLVVMLILLGTIFIGTPVAFGLGDHLLAAPPLSGASPYSRHVFSDLRVVGHEPADALGLGLGDGQLTGE